MKKTIVLLTILFFAIGCKTRQTSKSEQSNNIDLGQLTEKADNLTDNSKAKTSEAIVQEGTKEVVSVVTSNGLKITPIDSDKPVSYEDSDGNKFNVTNGIIESGQSETKTNSKEKHREEKKTEATKQNDIKKSSQGKSEGFIKACSVIKEKDTKSEPVFAWSVWWLIIPLLIIVIICRILYKRFKTPLKPL